MELGYEWRQPNPSEQVGLPFIPGFVFDHECAWMADRCYASEEMLGCAEELYRSDYPKLFEQLEALAALRARTPSTILNDAERTMRHFYRGAVFAIRALEATGYDFADLSYHYLERLQSFDGIDLELWAGAMQASSARHTEQLIDFIDGQYDLLVDEPEYLKAAMKIGARSTYALIAHSRACLEREKELAWDEHLALSEARMYMHFRAHLRD